MLLPTASTAPPGFIRLGPRAASFSTLKSRMFVPFHTPTAPPLPPPRATTPPPPPTCISARHTSDHSSDSYQPSESGDHSKLWMRGGAGSMVGGREDGGSVVGLAARRVRMVCRGREGSQVSICQC